MNSALKWKLIAGFIVVFVAGGTLGVFMSATTAHRALFGPHRHGLVAKAMKNRLQWQLRLTDEQMGKIAPIIDRTGAQLEQIRGETGRRVREAIAEAHREIRPLLTPEQQQRLQQMEERRRRWMQHRGAHWRGSATPEPEASPQ
jgi:Spy/CpxP family protein refolding chaperone